MTNQQDLELRKELDKIDWRKYLDYGTVVVEVWRDKKIFTTIKRTYQGKDGKP